MYRNEPTLEQLDDYNNNESTEKRLTIWIVILSGLLIGAIYGIIASNSTVSDLLIEEDKTGIVKF
ncbi:MAG: Unknown protein [uncultured Sulfurovum sp.]|uniref:Uncharacterized protein n=1 Tax=uncultured Sulfurovum sp. TaxID=269237 RepID=A0A6S6T1D2_9BACT|nr:MAG: Unknown protein [uncultured Sulfurovum sp.]